MSYSQSQYYLPSPREESPYSSQPIVLHHPHPMSGHHMQQQQHSDSIPIDPALSMYPSPYYSFQHQPAPMIPQHMQLTASLSSPSSQGSDTVDTPPMEQYSLHGTNSNGKRAQLEIPHDSRKKSRKDEEGEGASTSHDKGDEVKTKPTRGSRWASPSTISYLLLIIVQSMHCLSSLEDEMRWCRARSSL